nr:reverse transcriptase domain-containing protein [Tanacetum cinerariifolium]
MVQTPGSGISILLAVGTPSTGSGKLYCQWELSPGSGNALLSSNTNGKRKRGKNSFHYEPRNILLQKMPFGLRNAGATYQRLVDKAFHKQIGKNLEVYVDDLVIKSQTEDEIVRDIEETFKTLIKINMKLNPKKCTFGIEEGMFLGYKVNTRGLKVCPDKTAKAEEAFKKMKQLIAKLPMLVAPIKKEELIVYMAVTKKQ